MQSEPPVRKQHSESSGIRVKCSAVRENQAMINKRSIFYIWCTFTLYIVAVGQGSLPFFLLINGAPPSPLLTYLPGEKRP